MRRGVLFAVIVGFVALPQAHAAGASSRARPAEDLKRLIENKPANAQLVTFPETGWRPVRVVRGGASAAKEPAEKAETAEIIAFAGPGMRPVRVMRGQGRPSPAMTTQIVTFAGGGDGPVSILRGALSHPAAAELVDLDRIAFAVDGAESSHGTDLGMWRPDPDGPQGPMQVSAAAAVDVGGGDRFDLAANRALGRAYLERMYRRYGNWPDAIAAYNWGPGNLDLWITGGRPAAGFPLQVERYRDRVLRDAALPPFRLTRP